MYTVNHIFISFDKIKLKTVLLEVVIASQTVAFEVHINIPQRELSFNVILLISYHQHPHPHPFNFIFSP